MSFKTAELKKKSFTAMSVKTWIYRADNRKQRKQIILVFEVFKVATECVGASELR